MSHVGTGYDINQTFVVEPLDNNIPILSACTALYTNNILSCSGDTQIFLGNGVITFDGNLYTSNDLTANTINASTYYSGGTNLIDIINLKNITGGTFNNTTDTLTLYKQNNSTVVVTGFTDYYTTGATLIGNTVYFNRNDVLSAYTLNLSNFSADTYVTGVTFSSNQLIIGRNDGVNLNTFINTFTGLTINGVLNANSIIANNISATTISASTFYGDGSNLTGILTKDTFVTGGTYSSGTAVFTNNTGGTFSVTGFKTSDVFVTGGTYTNGNAIFTNNTGGTFNVSGFAIGGGGGQLFYLNLSQSKNGNRYLSTTASTAAEQSTGVTINTGATETIASFQSDVLGVTIIPGGIWSFYLHSYKEDNNASFNVFVEVYKLSSGGTSTLLFTTDPTAVTSNSPTPSMQLTDVYFSGSPVVVTDSVVAVVRATNTGNQPKIITLVSEGLQHYSYAVSTLPTQQGLTCDTLSGCSIIQTIQSNINDKLDKSGGTITNNLVIDGDLTATTVSASTYLNTPYWISGSTGLYTIKAKNDSSIDATGNYSHAEGFSTTASGDKSHAEGGQTTTNAPHAHAEGNQTTASGDGSHSEGQNTQANGQASHAEGYYSIAGGFAAHSEGSSTANGSYSHAEGNSTTASGDQSHAEGGQTIASGEASHAEGSGTTAFGSYSHAGGSQSIAIGSTSFVHGNNSQALGTATVVFGTNITGTTDNTVYVPYFNIKYLSGGTSVNNLGIDTDGYVVVGTTGGGTFTGGTVNGATVFTNGLTANTLSATTYQNLPLDIRVTGGTYSSGTAIFRNNTGGTFSVTGFSTGVAHAFTGTTTLDFGSPISGESSYATTAVINTNINQFSTVMIRFTSSVNHPDVGDSIIEELTVNQSDIIDGVSFNINAYAGGGTWGVYNVIYRIIN
jgi:hypothetical protein